MQGDELRYCEGMGRELPAVRVEGGEERQRLPAAVVIALFYPKTNSRFQHKTEKNKPLREAPCVDARGRDMSCRPLRQREARNASGCPRRWQLRYFTLKTKIAISTQNREK